MGKAGLERVVKLLGRRGNNRFEHALLPDPGHGNFAVVDHQQHLVRVGLEGADRYLSWSTLRRMDTQHLMRVVLVGLNESIKFLGNIHGLASVKCGCRATVWKS